MPTIEALLAAAELPDSPSARLDAELLLAHVLGKPRSYLRTWPEREPDAAQCAAFAALLARRSKGEPVAYLLGRQGFWSLELEVAPHTLIPRPDTELLVESALALGPAGPARVLDLGTGSGAIALALQHQRPQARVSAVDASPEALAVARGNAERLQLPVRFIHSHWLRDVQGAFDLIVSNPPYIRADDPHLAALTHEPLQALASGADGLEDIRAIIERAPAHLKPGGWLLLEHGYDQAEAVRALFAHAGWQNVQSRQDLAGIERCTGAKKA